MQSCPLIKHADDGPLYNAVCPAENAMKALTKRTKFHNISYYRRRHTRPWVPGHGYVPAVCSDCRLSSMQLFKPWTRCRRCGRSVAVVSLPSRRPSWRRCAAPEVAPCCEGRSRAEQQPLCHVPAAAPRPAAWTRPTNSQYSTSPSAGCFGSSPPVKKCKKYT